jgi:hypothetical protein
VPHKGTNWSLWLLRRPRREEGREGVVWNTGMWLLREARADIIGHLSVEVLDRPVLVLIYLGVL